MTKLAETYLRLDIRLAEPDILELRAYLQRRAATFAEGLFEQDPEFAVYVENGSIRVWLVVAGALYVGIGQYGSFRSGVDYAVKDARTFSERVLQDVKNSGVSEAEIRRFERRLGVPGKIKRIFRRLDWLEARGRDLSNADYEREIQSISRGLQTIFRAVDDGRDRALILDSLPMEIRSRLPERLPIPDHHQTRVVGLRPEKFDLPKPHLRLLDRVDDETRKRLQDEILYRFTALGSRFRLIPNE